LYSVQNGLAAWWQQDHVWWLPELREERIWRDGLGHHLARPSSALECTTVFHVGTNGFVYGSGAEVVFPDRRVGDLLDLWLHAAPDDLVREVPPPESAVGSFPNVGAEGALCYVEREVPIPAHVRVRGNRWYSWKSPLETLFPPFTDTLALRHLTTMREIAAMARTDSQRAVREATALASPYVSEGYSTAELTWFLPRVVERGPGEGLMWLVEEPPTHPFSPGTSLRAQFKKRVLATSLTVDEFLATAEWGRFRLSQVPVRRAWGPIGFFWALLIDSLESQEDRRGGCERCGGVVIGDKRKRFCGPRDNPDCCRERRAEDQRRSRARRSGVTP